MHAASAFAIGVIAGSAATLTYQFVTYAKECYPYKTTWGATKRMIDRSLWESTH